MTEQGRSGRSMWGGHFETDPAPLMAQINASIGFDKRLSAQDIKGSMAHARMLAAVGLLTVADRDAILAGLARIDEEIEAGSFTFSTDLEDIHFNVESRLTDLIGEAGRRLHTARSRNDQVATDFKLWVRDAIDRALGLLRGLQAVLLDLAEANAATVMPGFTHLQAAQPVTFGHHLMAYVEMLGRDRSRFADARANIADQKAEGVTVGCDRVVAGFHLNAETVRKESLKQDREGLCAHFDSSEADVAPTLAAASSKSSGTA